MIMIFEIAVTLLPMLMFTRMWIFLWTIIRAIIETDIVADSGGDGRALEE